MSVKCGKKSKSCPHYRNIFGNCKLGRGACTLQGSGIDLQLLGGKTCKPGGKVLIPTLILHENRREYMPWYSVTVQFWVWGVGIRIYGI